MKQLEILSVDLLLIPGEPKRSPVDGEQQTLRALKLAKTMHLYAGGLPAAIDAISAMHQQMAPDLVQVLAKMAGLPGLNLNVAARALQRHHSD